MIKFYKASIVILSILCAVLTITLINTNEKVVTTNTTSIKLMTDYIKLNNNSIPIEVCKLIAETINYQSNKEQIPPDLLMGMIEVESTWNPSSTSEKGAKGLMQIFNEDGIEINYNEAYDISYNISKGVAILKSKLKKSDGNLSKALTYYVGGHKNYNNKVYQSVGKFILYKAELLDSRNVKVEAIAENTNLDQQLVN